LKRTILNILQEEIQINSDIGRVGQTPQGAPTFFAVL